jgi:hypothetical protein
MLNNHRGSFITYINDIHGFNDFLCSANIQFPFTPCKKYPLKFLPINGSAIHQKSPFHSKRG